MKFKQIVALLFFLSFATYLLCPILMQGDCGFSVSDARCSSPCDAETDGMPQQPLVAANCCAIGLELDRPKESNPTTHLIQVVFPLIIAIPTLRVEPDLNPSTFHATQDTNVLYDYLPVYSISSRSPPLFFS